SFEAPAPTSRSATPDFESLQLFEATVRHRSINKAAAEFHRSQPGVTARLKQLERYVGLQLLHREATGTVATDAGVEFLSEVQRILQSMKDLEKRVDDM